MPSKRPWQGPGECIGQSRMAHRQFRPKQTCCSLLVANSERTLGRARGVVRETSATLGGDAANGRHIDLTMHERSVVGLRLEDKFIG